MKEKSSTPGRYAKGIERKQKILESAYLILREVGVGGASLRSIGESIGVSHGILTHYFGSRDEFLLEIINEHDRVTGEHASHAKTTISRLQAGAKFNIQFPGMVSLHTEMLAKSVQPGNDAARIFFAERFERGRHQLADDLIAEHGSALSHDEALMIADLQMAASDGLQIRWLLDPAVSIADTMGLLQRVAPKN
ncbi:MAG: TetR/AcrR family transcriptional regulator [Mycetocola sp.]